MARLAERAESVGRRHGLPIRLLDGGGGLGIPYADHEPELDLGALRDGLGREVARRSRTVRPCWGARLLFEPGRWLAGPIGGYVVRVLRTKRRGDRIVAVVDGGIHQLARPALIGQSQRVVHLGPAAPGDRPTARVDVVGPLCTGLDVLATDVPLPEPRTGDLLCVMDTGAYGFTESMPYFLSHPQPAELVASGGRAGVARLRTDPTEASAASWCRSVECGT